MFNLNPADFKPCRKKQHEIHVCKAPIGTIVIHKYTNHNVIEQLGLKKDKYYITKWEFEKCTNEQKALLNKYVQMGMINQVRTDKDYVAYGTCGELYVIKEDYLSKNYRVFKNGNWVKFSPEYFKEDWVVCHSCVNGQENMALFIPKKEVISNFKCSRYFCDINAKGIDHGKGDFIICKKGRDGHPDLSDYWVCNGLVFAFLYDNRGWTDYIELGMIYNLDLPSLVQEYNCQFKFSEEFNSYILQGMKERVKYIESSEKAVKTDDENVWQYCIGCNKYNIGYCGIIRCDKRKIIFRIGSYDMKVKSYYNIQEFYVKDANCKIIAKQFLDYNSIKEM